MAVGRFVDYAQITPGAYEFRTRDGRTVVAGGPDAEELRRRLDASRGPDLRLAQAPAQQSPTERIDALQRLGPAPAPVAEPAPPAPAPTAPTAGEAAVQAGVTGLDPRRIYAPVRVPGKPAVTREQLEEKASEGVPMPRQTDVVVEGGFPVDENYLQQLRDISAERRRLGGEAAYAAELAAQSERMVEREHAARAAESLRVQRERESEITRRVEQETRLWEEARAAVPKKVDPHRLFRGAKGAVAAIISAISQGLGAYGATLGGTRNFAQDLINAAIERDIAAQEHEIKTRGQEANNALSQLERTLGDRDQARVLLRQLQHDYVSAQRAEIAALTRRNDVMARAREWDLAEQERALREEQEFRRLAAGKVTRRVLAETAYPQAGVPAHERPPTEKEIQERIRTGQMELDYAQGVVGLHKTGAEIDKLQADAEKAQAGGEMPSDTARALVSVDSSIDAAVSIAEKYGYKVDRSTGRITETDKSGFPGRGLGGPGVRIPGVPASPEWQALQADLTAFGALRARVVNGGTAEPTPALIEAMTPDATLPDANIKAQIEAGLQQMLQIRRNIAANSTPQQRAQRETQKQQIGQEQRASPAIVTEEPF